MTAIWKNCTSEVTQNFCPNCGQASQLQKIDRKYILNEIQQLFNFEKGFFYTAKELLIRPGTSVKEYINSRELTLKEFIKRQFGLNWQETIAHSIFKLLVH